MPRALISHSLDNARVLRESVPVTCGLRRHFDCEGTIMSATKVMWLWAIALTLVAG